jgi:hypothetical protein
MRLFFASMMLGWAALASAQASAQTAFMEGHVFNQLTGVPLSGAAVRVVENVTVGPFPIVLASGVTDSNGFYQFEVDQFLGFPGIIEVTCATRTRALTGRGSASLREGVIRRDIYLHAGRRLARCRPPAAD